MTINQKLINTEILLQMYFQAISDASIAATVKTITETYLYRIVGS